MELREKRKRMERKSNLSFFFVMEFGGWFVLVFWWLVGRTMVGDSRAWKQVAYGTKNGPENTLSA